MKTKTIRVIIGSLVFIFSLIVFLLTVQPSVSFWDPGEISAASYSLMVPHPPGGPFWLLLGRFFSMIPFGSDIGFRINLVSVFASAFSVLLLYSIAVKLIENYRGKTYAKVTEALFTYIPAATGALAFSFCDTFWFNAVESNYFALSTLLFSLVVWLMMVWNEKRNEYGNEKYIILMAYIIGIATGVHLMSVLAILTFVSLVIMRKYVADDKIYLDSAKLFLFHIAILGVVAMLLWASQTGKQPPSPNEYEAFDSKFIWIMIVISVIYMGIFYKKIFNRNSFYIPLLIGGIILGITYPGIVKIFPTVLSKIGGPDPLPNLLIFVVLLAVLVYLKFRTSQKKRSIANLAVTCLLFVLLGNTTYTMIIIRANQNPPMNENNPANFTKLVYYLDREQYGDFPIFKRRFSEEPNQSGIFSNYSSDLDYLLNYQINHMFNRYLLWNFAGRESTIQDAPADFSQLWGIPFLVGLLGIFFHFRKDWKMASAFLILFIVMGYLIAFYQNQQQPQPRERDYFYAGAYFVFAVWIALGTREIIELIRENSGKISFNNIIGFSLLAVLFILVPLRMLTQNYFTHDRSKNWLPWDFSYNLLQSCKPNAILFTGGDNDTFPVWYLQYVEGVRRDVRIVNLSLANTYWYLLQLKNTEPYGAEKVPFTFSDQQMENIEPIRWNPAKVSLPVPLDVMKEFGVRDTTELRTQKITFTMPNTIQVGNTKAIRMQDIAVKDIITANNWKRPIYFATTCSPDSWIGLDEFLQYDGLAQRLTPVKITSDFGNVNAGLIHNEVFNPNPSFSKSYDPHFKFRGIADKDVFFDDMHTGLIMNYRNIFLRLADYYLEDKNDSLMCISTLNQMEKIIPRSHIPIDYRFLFEVGNIYYSAGAFNKFDVIADEVVSDAKSDLSEGMNNTDSPYNPFNIMENIYLKYVNLKEYDKALNILGQLEPYFPGNKQIQDEINRLNKLKNSNQ